jgi:hypothetical protein
MAPWPPTFDSLVDQVLATFACCLPKPADGQHAACPNLLMASTLAGSHPHARLYSSRACTAVHGSARPCSALSWLTHVGLQLECTH